MPLHLLGKKSWNVYNPENIARVQRDEAQAKAQEEEDERRMQEVDAERRIQILRGERPPTPPPPPYPPRLSEIATRQDRRTGDDTGRFRKRRRLAGEDDTDRDIRLAREDAEQAATKREELALTARKDNGDVQAPLLDNAGHFNLFPTEVRKPKAQKHAEAEAEAARKKRSYEDQYTMRFSNAAGFNEKAGRRPWYSTAGQDAQAPDAMPEKNVWGNEDPRRREREKARLDANDPLAAMKRGVRQLKATESERRRWNEGKRKELEALKADQRHRSKRRQRRRSASVDSLEDFQLDAPSGPEYAEKGRRSSHRSHRRHRRESSRDRSHRSSNGHSSQRSHRPRHNEAHQNTRHSRKPEAGQADGNAGR